MPSSSLKGKAETREWFEQHSEIKTVVDVGCGKGTYPHLLRKHNLKWIGIEIYEPYIEEFNLREMYSEIILGDIITCELPDADCIIFGDVLEHLPKENAKEVLTRAEAKYKHIIVSIPINYEQGPWKGNIHETHRSIWMEEELMELFKNYSFKRIYDHRIALFIK